MGVRCLDRGAVSVLSVDTQLETVYLSRRSVSENEIVLCVQIQIIALV